MRSSPGHQANACCYSIPMTWTDEQLDTIRQGIEERRLTRDRSWIRALHRIEVQVIQGFSYRAHSAPDPGLTMTIDEPVDRGGTGKGPGPIAHFLTGAATCLLNQFIRVSISRGYDLDFVGMLMRAEFRRDLGGGFEHIACTIEATGSLPHDDAMLLVGQAEELCYVHNTLKRAVRMSTILNVSGLVVATHETGPGA